MNQRRKYTPKRGDHRQHLLVVEGEHFDVPEVSRRKKRNPCTNCVPPIPPALEPAPVGPIAPDTDPLAELEDFLWDNLDQEEDYPLASSISIGLT